MKKLFFLLSIFAIMLSCSSDETSTPVTPPPAPVTKYTITLSAGEGGTVSTTGGEYEAGQTVSVTATPQGEYLFKDWSDGNTNATRTITVNSNSTLTANFEKRKYPLTINLEGEGEVIEEIVNAGRTTDYDSGTTVKLTAVPAEGWEFVGWTGNIESTEETVQIVIVEPKEVTATFEKREYELKINIIGVAKQDSDDMVFVNNINFTNSNYYNSGETITIEASNKDDKIFLGWSGDLESNSKSIEIEVNKDYNLYANFVSNLGFKFSIVGEGDVNFSNFSYYEGNGATLVKMFDAEIKQEFLDNFRGWEGLSDMTGGAPETNRHNSVSLNLEEQGYNLKVYFLNPKVDVKTDYSIIPYPNGNIKQIWDGLGGGNGTIYYQNDTGEYMLYTPGLGLLTKDQQDLLSYTNTPEAPGVVLKKSNDGYWEFFRVDEGIKGWGFRNIKLIDNKYIITGDGNEVGMDSNKWRGPLYYGVINGENINWTRVTTDNQMKYFHGSSGGDLNGDGLIDVGGTGSNGYGIFLQNSDGTFTEKNNLIDLDELPFAWNFSDLDGDGISEILTADYGAGDPNLNNRLNNLSIYKFNQVFNKFELFFSSNEPTVFFNFGRGATNIKVEDLNNDGIMDVLVAGEDTDIRTLEVWIGNADGKYTPNWSMSSNVYELAFVEPFLMDANNDGYLDILLPSSGPRDMPGVGRTYNHAILLNNGKGEFETYSKKKLEDPYSRTSTSIPYVKSNKLHFMSIFFPIHLINADKNTMYLSTEDINFDLVD